MIEKREDIKVYVNALSEKLKEEKKRQSNTTSKAKVIDLNPEGLDAESQPPSVPASKMKDFNAMSKEELTSVINCISCEAQPRCMMIATCKHMPFC